MKQKEIVMKIQSWIISGMFGVFLTGGAFAQDSIKPEEIDWIAIYGRGDYSKAAYTEMVAKCKTVGDGTYPNILDMRKFYFCLGGVFFPSECGIGLEFNDDCKCCDYPLGTTPNYMKKCNSVSYNSATFCNCADNPNTAMRGGGNKCSCNSSGIGVNYSSCTATPACPEMKDVDGKNRATRDLYGGCSVPSSVSFSDAGGTYEFTSACYYTE